MPHRPSAPLRLHRVGHACVYLEASGGQRLLLEPYAPSAYGGWLRFRPVAEVLAGEPISAAVSSHPHEDHVHPGPLPGDPLRIDALGVAYGGGRRSFPGWTLHAVPCFHDDRLGRLRGAVALYAVDVDGWRVVHLADLGHPLLPWQRARLADPDVCLVPFGGGPTLPPGEAVRQALLLRAKRLVPVHYGCEEVGPSPRLLPLPAGDRVEGLRVRRAGPRVDLDPALEPEPELLVMEPPAAARPDLRRGAS